MPAPRSIATKRLRRILAATVLGACASWISAAFAAAVLLDRPNVQFIANGTVAAMTRLPDGSVVFGGMFQSVNGTPRRSIAKMRADGTLDPAFHPDVHYSIDTLASDAGGNVYAGGSFLDIDGVMRRHLAKLDGASGAVDAAWDPSPDGSVEAIAVDADGNVFVAGSFAAIGGTARHLIAKLSGSGTGSVDATWDPNPTGGAITTAVSALAVSDAHLYVAGSFYEIGGRGRTDLAKLSLSGSGEADASWNPVPSTGTTAPYDSVSAISIDAAGEVYVAGTFNSINGTTRYGIAKLAGNGTGAVDNAWDAAVPWPGTVSHVVAGDDGAVYAYGNFDQIGGALRPHVAKLSAATGAADTSWDAQAASSVVSEPVHALLAGSTGTVVVGGAFIAMGGEPRLSVAVLDPSGAANDTLTDAETPGSVNAIVEQANGGLIVAGEFAKADGQSRPHLARLDPDGLLDATWNPGVDEVVNTVALDSVGNVYVGGKFEHAGGVPRLHIARFTAAGAVDATWNPTASEAPSNLISVNTLAIGAADSLYVGGYFTQFGAAPRGGMAKLAFDGSLDLSWNPGVATEFPNIYTLSVDGDSVFVGGMFHHAGGAPRENLAKIAAAGSGVADAAWNPVTDGWTVYDVIPDHAGSVYVNGPFAHIGGEARNGLARLAAEGSGAPDPTWNPALTASPLAVAFDGTYVYATLYDFSVGTTILRFGADCLGVADADWNPVFDDSVYVLADGAGDRLFVGGRFSATGGAARGGLAAFDAAASSGCPALVDRIFADDFDD